MSDKSIWQNQTILIKEGITHQHRWYLQRQVCCNNKDTRKKKLGQASFGNIANGVMSFHQKEIWKMHAVCESTASYWIS